MKRKKSSMKPTTSNAAGWSGWVSAGPHKPCNAGSNPAPVNIEQLLIAEREEGSRVLYTSNILCSHRSKYLPSAKSSRIIRKRPAGCIWLWNEYTC